MYNVYVAWKAFSVIFKVLDLLIDDYITDDQKDSIEQYQDDC